MMDQKIHTFKFPADRYAIKTMEKRIERKSQFLIYTKRGKKKWRKETNFKNQHFYLSIPFAKLQENR